MQNWPWRAVIIGVVATILVYTATRPDPDARSISSAAPEELIEQLGSSRDVVRRAASARLIAEGAGVIPRLVAAAEQADEDQLRQILVVLEDMYVSADASMADAAEDAIEQLSRSERREVRKGAEELIGANMSRRQLRAYNKIESYSGKLMMSPSAVRGGEVHYPDLIVIDSNWTGGDEGLKYLRRLRGVTVVHISDDAPVSETSIKELKDQAQIAVRREYEGCLGVELTDRFGGLAVRWVVPNSPADIAGLQSYDRLLGLDGERIDLYYDFLRILRSHHPGDVVSLEISRGETNMSLDVKLGTDFATGRCRCLEDLDAGQGEAQTNADVDLPLQRAASPLSDHLASPAAYGTPGQRHLLPGLGREPLGIP